ncbi:MAG: hypothetical protein WCO16_03675 [bacterium]
MTESVEKIKSGRELLQQLESGGQYVFHGSENPNLDSLEPRQGYNYRDGIQEPDGDPAVFASNKADYAILMALVNKHNCPKGYSSSAGTIDNEKGEIVLELKVRKDALEQLTDESSGYIYIFNKSDFLPRTDRRVEYVSKIPVTSVNKVLVKKSDLPPYVEVFEK